MAHQSFARTVFEKAMELAAKGSGEVYCGDVADALSVKTRVERKRCLNILSDLAIDGKIVRIRQGVYGPVQGIKQLDKREVMWRLLRMRKRITVEDLVELAEVSPKYAREWLLMLLKNGVVRKNRTSNQPGVWILLHDKLAAPVNEENAKKLRELRKRRKTEVLARLDAISSAVTDVRQLLDKMEEE